MNKRKAHGCLTCKIRKIKCDETRPYCLRCIRTGRKCDGYSVPSSSALLLTSPKHVPSSSPSFTSQEEVRAFDFYLQRSSKALSGELDTELWSKLIVQLSVSEPAVKHAVLAISGLHRGTNQTQSQASQVGASLDDDQKFGLNQYSRAMKALSSWRPAGDDHNKTTLPLVLCLLFVAVEFLKGDQKSSQIHICQGRKIIAELGEHDLDPGVVAFLRGNVIPMYQRLGLACYLFGAIPSPIPRFLRPSQDKDASKPLEFSSIEEARDHFFDMLDEILQFVNIAQSAAYTRDADLYLKVGYDRHGLSENQTNLLSRLEEWNGAFTVLTVSLPSAALPVRTLHLLRIYYHIAKTWVSVALLPSEVVFDQHLDSFASIISSSVVIIDSLGAGKQAGYTGLTFSFETEAIAPLYWVCIKCRQPMLRRAAFKLLERGEMKSRRENLWNTEAITAVSQLLITAEESPQSFQGTNSENESASSEEEPASMDHDARSEHFAPVQSYTTPNLPPRAKENTYFLHDQLSEVIPVSNADLAGTLRTTEYTTNSWKTSHSQIQRQEGTFLRELLRVPSCQPPNVAGLADHGLPLSEAGAHGVATSLLLQKSMSPSLPESTIQKAVHDNFNAAYIFSQLSTPLLSESASFNQSSALEQTTQQTWTKFSASHMRSLQPLHSSVSPFGVPESARIKNLILGPSNDQGMWVTMFRDPLPGRTEWDVVRKFLHLV